MHAFALDRNVVGERERAETERVVESIVYGASGAGLGASRSRAQMREELTERDRVLWRVRMRADPHPPC